MAYRLVILFGCIILFINGCNNLISGVAGTHKLRQYDMSTVVSQGIGDADFIQVTNAWSTGNYRYLSPDQPYRRPMWLYPVFDERQMMRIDSGDQVRVKLLAWTQKLDPECESRGDCIVRGKTQLKGVIASNRQIRKQVQQWNDSQVLIDDNPIIMEVGRSPIAWYWNGLMVVGALLIGFFMEKRNFERNKKSTTN